MINLYVCVILSSLVLYAITIKAFVVNCVVVYAVRLVIVAKKNIFDFDAVLFLFSNLIVYKSYYRFFVFEFLLLLFWAVLGVVVRCCFSFFCCCSIENSSKRRVIITDNTMSSSYITRMEEGRIKRNLRNKKIADAVFILFILF